MSRDPTNLQYTLPSSSNCRKMSFAQRFIPPMLMVVAGVATGIYVFDPILKQYQEDTHGTFKPSEIDELKVTDRTKQEAKEQEERIKAFKGNIDHASGLKESDPNSHLARYIQKETALAKEKAQTVGNQAEHKLETTVDSSKSLLKQKQESKTSSDQSSSGWWPFSSSKQ